jgi:hypothetical protein
MCWSGSRARSLYSRFWDALNYFFSIVRYLLIARAAPLTSNRFYSRFLDRLMCGGTVSFVGIRSMIVIRNRGACWPFTSSYPPGPDVRESDRPLCYPETRRSGPHWRGPRRFCVRLWTTMSLLLFRRRTRQRGFFPSTGVASPTPTRAALPLIIRAECEMHAPAADRSCGSQRVVS